METISTRDYTGVTTKQIIVEMLTECTGQNICDSGSAYGRNWQRNQGRNFEAEPAVSCSFRVWRDKDQTGPGSPEPHTSVSLYHWMNSALEFDPEMQEELDQYAAEHDDDGWLQVQEGFAVELYERESHDAEPETINTYNDPDSIDLSQVLQYITIFKDGGNEPSHLIVSVHGGCDVRGGYSAPKCFSLKREYYDALDAARVNGLYAGDSYWDYSTGGWRDCYSDNEDIPDVLELPSFNLEWFEDHPRMGEPRLMLADLNSAIRDLGDGRYTPETVDRLRPAMENAARDLRRAVTKAVLDELREQYEAFTYLDGERLMLCYTANDGRPVEEEVKASSHFL